MHRNWYLPGIFVLFSVALQAQPRELQLLGHWSDTTLVGSRFYDNTYNEVWGLAVGDREYAIIGSTAGTHFIDVTEPTAPVQVQFVPGTFQGDGVVHRDYHDYRGFLYAVCDEGASTLQIMDITGLPDTVRVVYNSNEFFARAHNIFIDSSQAKMYIHLARGGRQPNAPMQLIDIAVPDTPRYIRGYNRFGLLAISQVHDGYIENNLAYLNCGPSGFALVDFTDPINPNTLSILTPTDYPFAGYNHSGWPSCDGRFYYMADENHGYDMKIVDLEDPTNPVIAGTFNAGSPDPTSIPHNQLVACNHLYVAYYYDGLQVFDVTRPDTPKVVAYFPTSVEPAGTSYKGAWGVYPYLPSGNILVSDMQEGLFVIEPVGDNCYSTPVCGSPTPVKNRVTESLSIFPNPSTGETLQWKGISMTGEVTLDIFDLYGRSVYRAVFDRIEDSGKIELPGSLVAGSYRVQITNSEKRYTATWLVLP